MRIDVDTGDYTRNHGAAQRGRGSWAFCIVDPRRGDYLDYVIWVSGTYSGAKRVALRTVRGLPVDNAVNDGAYVQSLAVHVPAAIASGNVDTLYVCS